jgi:uncharacterized membrane protein YeaQ/YmgE (transglycosylase-associated protein family)
MDFVAGFLVWAVLAVIGGVVVRSVYRADHTEAWLTFVFAVFGAFIGGMLGTSPYVFHDPLPLRFGGVLGAALGSLLFPFLYHFIGRKAV